MLARLTNVPFNYLILFFIGAALIIFAGIGLNQYFQKYDTSPYKIGVIINQVEITPKDMEVFKSLIGKQLESINKEGGIGGRPVKALYLDDGGNLKKLRQLVQQTIQDKNLIAYIGCNHSSQIRAIRDLVGPSKVPFIGGFTLTQLVDKYPNIYTSEPGIKEISVVFRNLLKTRATKAAFIIQDGDLGSEALLQVADKLDAEEANFDVTLRKRYPSGHNFTQNEIRNLADSLKQQADFLVLSIDPVPTGLLLDGLWRQGMKMPVFCGMADMTQLDMRSTQYRAGELYDINAFAIPDVLNMRMEEHMTQYGKQFQELSTYEFRRAFAARHADEIGMIKEASLDKSLPPGADIRARINAGLSKYINGAKIFRGLYADWYFTPERSFASVPLLSWSPRNFPLPVLAPMQFMRTDTGMQSSPQLPVLYADMDMVQISQVNDQDGTFYATFYLELFSAKNLNLDQVDFANAARNKINQDPLVDAKLIQFKKDSIDVVFYNYHYKVSGKFNFDSDLKRYPFDRQKFPVIIQSKNALRPFLVQPPDVDIRDTVFESRGWLYWNNYVGYNQDIISIENTFDGLQLNIPSYKFSFVYEMKRAGIDFNLKTLVPLLAILIITYFSAYIPHREFEALCAVQVTALLASIALYFATYKPEMENATVSDKIFIFAYVMITSFIGASILHYVVYRENNTIEKLARIYQQVVFPIVVIAFIFYLQA